MSETLGRIQDTVAEIIDLAPRAGLVSREWSVCVALVETATLLEQDARRMRHLITEEELQMYLTRVLEHKQFLEDTIAGRRRAHPERSKRVFL